MNVREKLKDKHRVIRSRTNVWYQPSSFIRFSFPLLVFCFRTLPRSIHYLLYRCARMTVSDTNTNLFLFNTSSYWPIARRQQDTFVIIIVHYQIKANNSFTIIHVAYLRSFRRYRVAIWFFNPTQHCQLGTSLSSRSILTVGQTLSHYGDGVA